MKDFVLEQYIKQGVQNVIRDITKATFQDPAGTLFVGKYAISAKKANDIRDKYEAMGEHIPPFLIASITTTCNLHCKGCYARENSICSDEASTQMSAENWDEIFNQAEDLGIGFILLVGGEPLMRPDVVKKAAAHPGILFPVFTNGTIMNPEYLKLFAKHRNLVPVISIEGHMGATDDRRGPGTHKLLMETMEKLQKEHLLFGASITVTRENMHEVMSPEFVEELLAHGCKGIFYIEYVPVDEKSMELAPTPEDNQWIEKTVQALREQFDRTLFISFPGDEHKSGGCLAAGRGFFHINPHGGAEPCPASPFSDANILDVGLREALKSPLFAALRDQNILMEDHAGGCVLFENKERVEAIMAGK